MFLLPATFTKVMVSLETWKIIPKYFIFYIFKTKPCQSPLPKVISPYNMKNFNIYALEPLVQ